jgi:hypothetical protein
MAPVIVLAVRLREAVEQTGLLLEATGESGVELTTTEVVPAGPVQLPTVAITE